MISEDDFNVALTSTLRDVKLNYFIKKVYIQLERIKGRVLMWIIGMYRII